MARRFHQRDWRRERRWFPPRPFGKESDMPKIRNIEREGVQRIVAGGQPTRTSSTSATEPDSAPILGIGKDDAVIASAATGCPGTTMTRWWRYKAASVRSADENPSAPERNESVGSASITVIRPTRYVAFFAATAIPRWGSAMMTRSACWRLSPIWWPRATMSARPTPGRSRPSSRKDRAVGWKF